MAERDEAAQAEESGRDTRPRILITFAATGQAVAEVTFQNGVEPAQILGVACFLDEYARQQIRRNLALGTQQAKRILTPRSFSTQ
jgi:hypothetical protein